MKTEQLQKLVESTGSHLRREEYAGLSPRGHLVSRHRWSIHAMATGVLLCRGTTANDCFKRWLALGWKPKEAQ